MTPSRSATTAGFRLSSAYLTEFGEFYEKNMYFGTVYLPYGRALCLRDGEDK